jgi:hypothetical protein
MTTVLLYLLNGLLQFLLMTSVEHHKTALGSESRSNRFADALACSSDKYYLLL